MQTLLFCRPRRSQMKNMVLHIGALAVLSASMLYSQEIAGDWQGTLDVGAQKLRSILHITKAENEGWGARFISVDQGDMGGIPVNSLTVQGSTINFAVDAVRGSYTGTISGDGNSISGIWTQGRPLPLDFRRATEETLWKDRSPHSVQFVTVDDNVKLEVLDWGGSGRPVVLLAGLGNTAHAFDSFAPKLAAKYHVYGITRRGFGPSSAPAPIAVNYTADRLGDDVLAVCAFLKLNRPLLVGHSIAGEELSSIGSRHPERVAGLVYLDAAYGYAFYDRARGDLMLDSLELQKQLAQLQPGNQPPDPKQLVNDLLQTALPQFERDLQRLQKDLEDAPPPPPAAGSGGHSDPMPAQAILAGQQKYTEIRSPVLAIYAFPHDRGGPPNADAAARAKAEARDEERTGAQIRAFEAGVPSAHVVRLPHASHFVFRSNEADVLREMNAFIDSLPRGSTK
jgi:pimeloyl-ACP methyl ester carboxylesterase